MGPPVTFSMSCLAKTEAARVKGTLDTDFMKRLALALGEEKAQVDDFTDDDLLRVLIKPLTLDNFHQATIVEIVLFSILDRDPLVPLKWMKNNRLSFLSIPGIKAEACERVRVLLERGKSIGLNDNDLRMLEVLAEKIK